MLFHISRIIWIMILADLNLCSTVVKESNRTPTIDGALRITSALCGYKTYDKEDIYNAVIRGMKQLFKLECRSLVEFLSNVTSAGSVDIDLTSPFYS
ncbi:hypothetical protein HI914_02877 [Erysiphe necator]|nr:hypothetical protein HI914_02877 [Erysiphe necator]